MLLNNFFDFFIKWSNKLHQFAIGLENFSAIFSWIAISIEVVTDFEQIVSFFILHHIQ